MRCTVVHSLLVALGACAGSLALATPDDALPPSNSPTPRSASSNTFSSLFRRNMGSMLEKRADAGIRTATDVSKLDLVNWAKDTAGLCAEMVQNLTVSNDAQVVACYNLPLVISDTGVFVIDLRLFSVGKMKGDWDGVQNFNALISYADPIATQQRNVTQQEMDATEEGLKSSGNPDATEWASQAYVGQVDQTLLSSSVPSDEVYKAMLTPTIMLEADVNGKTLKTNVSTPEAFFLNGAFSNISTLTPSEVAALTDVPFTLPGVKIEITPIGLYFFSTYMAVSCIIYGWGTFERAKFRDQYRKRVALMGNGR